MENGLLAIAWQWWWLLPGRSRCRGLEEGRLVRSLKFVPTVSFSTHDLFSRFFLEKLLCSLGAALKKGYGGEANLVFVGIEPWEVFCGCGG